MNPGAIWQAAKLAQAGAPERLAAMCRALGANPDDRRAFYATLPFAPLEWGGRWWFAIADRPPPTIGTVAQIVSWSPEDIDAVVLFDPKTGKTRELDERAPELMRPAAEEDGMVVYADARRFVADWMRARASAMTGVTQLAPSDREALTEPFDGYMPGALAVGGLDACRWRPHELPGRVRAADEAAAKTIRRLIRRDANLPTVSVA